MKKFFLQNKIFFVFSVLLIIALFIMTIDYHGSSYLEWMEGLVLKTISPINRGVTGLSSYIKDYFGAIAEFKEVRGKNNLLIEEVEKLQQENAILQEKLITYDRLTKLLELKESFSFKMIPAQVISREPGNWFNSMMIDKGTEDGVQKNMAIATYNGLVGKVVSSDSHSSKVQLILDQRSAVGSMIQRSRDIGVLKGSRKNYCYMEYLSRDADIKRGDLVITSGLGSIFPKGIIIGKVVEIKKDTHALFQEVIINPFVDFTKLEEVFVVEKTD